MRTRSSYHSFGWEKINSFGVGKRPLALRIVKKEGEGFNSREQIQNSLWILVTIVEGRKMLSEDVTIEGAAKDFRGAAEEKRKDKLI